MGKKLWIISEELLLAQNFKFLNSIISSFSHPPFYDTSNEMQKYKL